MPGRGARGATREPPHMNESTATHSGCKEPSAAVGSSSAEKKREREGEREREREEGERERERERETDSTADIDVEHRGTGPMGHARTLSDIVVSN